MTTHRELQKIKGDIPWFDFRMWPYDTRSIVGSVMLAVCFGATMQITERVVGDGETAGEIFKQLEGFAGYGFCKSHAASFALIAYASAYLKAHHPAAFLAALLNAWPMGFYHPATIVPKSQEHSPSKNVLLVPSNTWRTSAVWGERFGLDVLAGSRRLACSDLM